MTSGPLWDCPGEGTIPLEITTPGKKGLCVHCKEWIALHVDDTTDPPTRSLQRHLVRYSTDKGV